MPSTHRNRLVTAISNAPGTTGALTIAAAASGYRTFGAADNSLSFDVSIVDGTAWEIRTGCVYTHAGTSLSRGTLEDSSTGSAITLTSSAVLTVTMTAGMGNALVKQINRPAIIVRNAVGTAQSVGGSTLAKMTTCLNEVALDTSGFWNAATQTFQPTVAGFYDVNATITWDSMGIGKNSDVQIVKNQPTSPEYFNGQYLGNQNSSIMALTASAIVYLNGSTDILELWTYNSDTVSRNTRSNNAGRVLLSAIYLGS